jgi:hypothetical protein
MAYKAPILGAMRGACNAHAEIPMRCSSCIEEVRWTFHFSGPAECESAYEYGWVTVLPLSVGLKECESYGGDMVVSRSLLSPSPVRRYWGIVTTSLRSWKSRTGLCGRRKNGCVFVMRNGFVRLRHFGVDVGLAKNSIFEVEPISKTSPLESLHGLTKTWKTHDP